MKILLNRLIGTKKSWSLIGTLLLIAMLVVGFVYLKKFKYMSRYHFYSVKVENLPAGIMIGTPINLFGLKVGKVEEIGIRNDFDGVELRLSILDEINKNLATDTSLIISPRLFGQPVLTLSLGKGTDKLEKEDDFHVVVEKSIDSLLRLNLESLYKDIIPEMTSAVQNISKVGEGISSIDFDRISMIMKGVEENMDQAGELMQSVNTLYSDLRNMMVKMNSTLGNIESFSGRINSFAENTMGNEKNLADSINRIFKNTEVLLQNGNDISQKTKVLMDVFKKSGEDLNAISPNIVKITNALPTLLNSINKMVEDFSMIGMAMQRHWLLRGSVKKVKRNIEKEGNIEKTIEETIEEDDVQ